MSERAPLVNPVDRLIAADPGIVETRLQEFRMNLEQSLESLEQKARSSRTNIVRAIVALVLCAAFAYVLNTIEGLGQRLHPALGMIWVLATWASLISAIVIIGRYWHTYRPALERGRTDLQIAMFGELQRQIGDLNRRLEKSEERSPRQSGE